MFLIPVTYNLFIFFHHIDVNGLPYQFKSLAPSRANFRVLYPTFPSNAPWIRPGGSAVSESDWQQHQHGTTRGNCCEK